MSEALFWWVQSVEVSTYATGKRGDTWADPQPVQCWVEDDNDLVRDSTGREVVSSARVYAPTDALALFTPGSKVTLPGGRTSRVLAVKNHDSGSLNIGLDHIAVVLQ